MTRETQPKGPRISADAYDLLKQLAAAGAAGIGAWDGRPARPLKTAGYAVEKVIKKVTCLVITAAGKKAFATLPVGGNKKAAGAKRGATKKGATKKGATKKAMKAVRGTTPSGKQTTKLVEKKAAAAPAKAPKVKKPRAKKAAKPEVAAPRRRGRKAEAASAEGEMVNVTLNATPETSPTE